MLSNDVKLVIWDLDDTFWKGTLAEGAIVPIEVCKNCVITLAQRGIISSISSKNDFEEAKSNLTNFGVWDYFVYPRIEYGPKGKNIAALIEEMNLRAENVLFIDDNVLNLEEAKYYAPGVMVAHPEQILAGLLDLPQLAGKDDRQLTRLQQYKRLEKKSVERTKSSLSNEDFLRQCEIEVTIDYEVEKNFDRIVELANRTNQLNFTKRRLETPKAIADFRNLCNSYGIVAAIVRVSDKYGDYGAVGYFVARRLPHRNELLHFVFSCRTMNMGVEQYVYEYLRQPLVKIIPPVSNPIKCFASIDWIKEGTGAKGFSLLKSDKELVLLGGCELLQLASLCSNRTSEFVNVVRKGIPTRFDDAGFILSDRKTLAADRIFAKLRYWSYEDAIAFDKSLKSSQIVIVALFALFWDNYFVTNSGVKIRFLIPHLQSYLKKYPYWFVKNFRYCPMSFEERLDLVSQSLDRIAEISPQTCDRFALGLNTRGLPEKSRGFAHRRRYNDILRRYCEKRGTFTFVDVEAIVAPQDQFDPDHFNRRGYLALANFISDNVGEAGRKEPERNVVGSYRRILKAMALPTSSA